MFTSGTGTLADTKEIVKSAESEKEEEGSLGPFISFLLKGRYKKVQRQSVNDECQG